MGMNPEEQALPLRWAARPKASAPIVWASIWAGTAFSLASWTSRVEAAAASGLCLFLCIGLLRRAYRFRFSERTWLLRSEDKGLFLRSRSWRDARTQPPPLWIPYAWIEGFEPAFGRRHRLRIRLKAAHRGTAERFFTEMERSRVRRPPRSLHQPVRADLEEGFLEIEWKGADTLEPPLNEALLRLRRSLQSER